MQEVAEVCNTTYRPKISDEKDLFAKKQTYMFAVFTDQLQTDYGRTLIQEHQDYSDAQAVYRKLQKHALKSTKAAIKSSYLLAYLTTAKFGSDSWRVTCNIFLLHWASNSVNMKK